jgi:hypothetical protein
MKIENRLSTLTNKIKENLSLLGDGCSLLTLVNNENTLTGKKSGTPRNSSLFDEFVCKLGLFWHAWAILKRE